MSAPLRQIGARLAPRAPWLLLAIVCTAVLFGQTASYGFLGLDTYQLIEASRVASLRDLADSFTERLLDTRSFYRPVLKLSIALDYAFYGLGAAGYQLTSALFFAGCALSLGWLVERLVGAGARVAPTVAVAAFLFFPQHFEILPVLERRPEMMVGAFMLLALALQVSPRALAARRPPLLPALVGLLALGSKDNGLILPPLCVLAVFLVSPRTTYGARVRHALWSASPHVVVLVAFLAARAAVLAGVGLNDPFGRMAAYPREVVGMLERVARSEPLSEPSALQNALLIAFPLALALAWMLRARGETEAAARAVRPGCAAWMGAGWLLLLTLTYAARGHMYSWYTFLLVPGWAMLLGAAAEFLFVGTRAGAPARRAASALALALLALLILWPARLSPIVHRYAEWEWRTARVETFFSELGARIDTAQLGDVVSSPDFPRLDEPPDRGPFVHDVPTVQNLAIKSWARLTRPDRRVRVFHEQPGRAPRMTETAIVVSFRYRGEERGVRD